MQCPFPVSDGEEVTAFTVLMDHFWEPPGDLGAPPERETEPNREDSSGLHLGMPLGTHLALITSCTSWDVQ